MSQDTLHVTGQDAIGIILQRRRWRWLGHVLTMEPAAHARAALLIWTPEGSRERGRTRTPWRRTLIEEIRSASIGWERVLRLAQDRAIMAEGLRWGPICHRAWRDWVSEWVSDVPPCVILTFVNAYLSCLPVRLIVCQCSVFRSICLSSFVRVSVSKSHA